MILAFYNIAIFDTYLGVLAHAFKPAPRMFDYKTPPLGSQYWGEFLHSPGYVVWLRYR